MEKYFANYNQSLALKELGFDEPCFGIYFPSDKSWKDIKFKNSQQDNIVASPLKSQVFEWFRKEHQLFGVVLCDLCWNISGGVANDYGDAYDWDSERYETYEEAESACIDKLIEIVKNK